MIKLSSLVAAMSIALTGAVSAEITPSDKAIKLAHDKQVAYFITTLYQCEKLAPRINPQYDK